MKLSLKWKFTGFIALLLLFTVGMLSILILKGILDYQRDQTESTLEGQAQTAQLRITQQYVTGTRLDPAVFMQHLGQKLAVELGVNTGMRVILYDQFGSEVGNSLPIAGRSDVGDALNYALHNHIAYFTEGDVMEYLAPLQGPDGQLGVIQFQASLTAQHAFYRNIQYLFLIAGVAVLSFAIPFGLIYMNRQANAIRQLQAATDRIRRGDFADAPVLDRHDELGSLSHGIAEMSQAIQSNMQAQKQFMNNISHEFKTPLTSIQAYADLLHMYEDDLDLIREARVAISKESARLYELVEKALQLSALEKYEFDYQPERIEVKPILEDIFTRMKAKADKFGITLILELVPADIWADRQSVEHIFVNLLDNAIKYNTTNGSVTIANRIVEERIEVSFQDSGVGIPEKKQVRVFDPFYTVNKTRARQSGGSGLGLALVQQLVDKQGGHIRLESTEGIGSLFTVSFDQYNSQKHLQV